MHNITIGIPTYKRPLLLKRALNSILKSKVKNLKIIVSIDGKDEMYSQYKKVEAYFSHFNFIKFYYQKKKIGSLSNFFFLRDITQTYFFIWLADDDEIDGLTINKLYEILKKNNKIVTAVPYWQLVYENNKRKIIKPETFNSGNLLLRLLKYLHNPDDCFFYGLHRTEFLKKCSFDKYWWPNNLSLSNWCYVFQIDLIIQGKIILLNNKKYKWINHDYGKKFYTRSKANNYLHHLFFIIRKINIYYLYLIKIFKWKKYHILLIIFLPSLFFLVRDIIYKEPIYKKIKFNFK